MSVVVHHLNNSRSQRILWLLEELEVPYELKRYERHPKTKRAPDSLTAIHPLGKSPILEHDGRTLAETGAIVEYILDSLAKGTLRPEAGTEDFFRDRVFLHYAEGSMMTPLLVKLIMGQVRSAPVPFFLKPIMKGVASKVDGNFSDPEIEKHMNFLNDELEGREWFAGDLSGADIMLSFPLEAAAARVDLSRFSNLEAFIKRVHARPAYARGLERGGPYDYA